MQIKKLNIVNLYQKTSKKIIFDNSLNLLVGINGSGKTSIINCIDILLKSDFEKLSRLSFQEIALFLKHKNTDWMIKCKKEEDTFFYHLENLTDITDKYDVISGPSFSDEFEIPGATQQDFKSSFYLNKEELATYRKIKSFPQPITISLDRTITATVDDYSYEDLALSSTANKQVTKSKIVSSPIEQVKKVTQRAFLEYIQQYNLNDKKLKARLTLSALQTPTLSIPNNKKKYSQENIKLLHNKVKTYFSDIIKINSEDNKIDQFFTDMEARSKDPKYSQIIQYKYQQLDIFADAFDEFEKSNHSAFEKLQNYLDALNNLFKDSKKEIFFNRSTVNIAYKDILNTETIGYEIEKLSSGEKQILILFTFIAFMQNSNSVFILDEPEISLHPKWQRDFIKTFISLSPENSQIIIATHSPEIVGKNKEKCIKIEH